MSRASAKAAAMFCSVPPTHIDIRSEARLCITSRLKSVRRGSGQTRICPCRAAPAGRGRSAARRSPPGCPPARPGRYRPGSVRGRRAAAFPGAGRRRRARGERPRTPRRTVSMPPPPMRRRRSGAGRHTGGRDELPRERVSLVGSRLDAVVFELPRPDPRPHRRGRRPQLERETHAAQHGVADRSGVVHGPESRSRRPLQQPVHIDL